MTHFADLLGVFLAKNAQTLSVLPMCWSNTIVCVSVFSWNARLHLVEVCQGQLKLKLTPQKPPAPTLELESMPPVLPASVSDPASALSLSSAVPAPLYSPWMESGYYKGSGNACLEDKLAWFDDAYSFELVHITRYVPVGHSVSCLFLIILNILLVAYWLDIERMCLWILTNYGN